MMGGPNSPILPHCRAVASYFPQNCVTDCGVRSCQRRAEPFSLPRILRGPSSRHELVYESTVIIGRAKCSQPGCLLVFGGGGVGGFGILAALGNKGGADVS